MELHPPPLIPLPPEEGKLDILRLHLFWDLAVFIPQKKVRLNQCGFRKFHLGNNTGVYSVDLCGDELNLFADGTRHTVCKVANAAGAGKIKSSAAARQDFTGAN
ncbi:MAG: hypothetical protein PVF56_00920 [Desulfobacterales bacterium]|jgi:hypothetical protein